MSTFQEPDIPLTVQKRRKIWHVAFMFRLCLHWLLLVRISGGSAAVAGKIINEYWRDILALTVAICSALLATLQPQQRARSYRQAWIGLNLAIKAEKKMSLDILEAMRKGEEAIGSEYQAEMIGQSENSKP